MYRFPLDVHPCIPVNGWNVKHPRLSSQIRMCSVPIFYRGFWGMFIIVYHERRKGLWTVNLMFNEVSQYWWFISHWWLAHWVGLRENLQEAMGFWHPKKEVSCKLSLKPSQWFIPLMVYIQFDWCFISHWWTLMMVNIQLYWCFIFISHWFG